MIPKLVKKLKSVLNISVLTIKINWIVIIFYANFLSYGYFGSLTSINLFKNIVLTTIVVIIQLFFGYVAWKHKDWFYDQIRIRTKQLLLIILLFVFFLLINNESLLHSIVGDQLLYVNSSLRHSLIILDKLFPSIDYFDDIKVKYLVHLINFLILLSLTFLYLLVRKLKWPIKTIVLVIILIFLRLIIGYFGGNGSPHPSLNLILTFISGAIFGISDFAMKSSYLLGFTLFIFSYYVMLNRKFNELHSVLLSLSLATIPLLMRLSSFIEPSLWGSLFFIFFLIDIRTSSKINFVRLICMAALITMMRLPVFIVFIPLTFLCINHYRITKISFNNIKFFSFIFLPILLFAPFLLFHIFNGSAATDELISLNFIDRFVQVFETNIIFISIFNAIEILWIPFIILAFIPLKNNKRFKSLIILVFFIICLIIFFSIKPILWGEPKYIAEYAIPFIALGFIFSIILINNFLKSNFLTTIVLFFFISYNLINHFNYPSGNLNVEILVDDRPERLKNLYGGSQGMIHYVYNYKEAYKYVIDKNIESDTFSLGVNYGIMPEIFNGYSLSDINTLNNINDDYLKHTGVNSTNNSVINTANFLNKDSRIQNLLLGFTFNKEDLIKELKKMNWSEGKVFENNKYGSKVIILTRDNPQ